MMAALTVVGFGVGVTPSTVRFMIVMMVILLLGRAVYDLLRRMRGGPSSQSVGVVEALTSRKTSPAAGYVIGLLVIVFLLFLQAHLRHFCASAGPGAHDFWGDCPTTK